MQVHFYTIHVDGVRIYRKTMRESAKGRPSPVKTRVRIRSRQQRVCIHIAALLHLKNLCISE